MIRHGLHTRAARGSKAPVRLNDAFREHVAKKVAINSAAKQVHDLLKIGDTAFKEAMLWQKMLSRIRKTASVVLCLHFMSGNNGKATGTLANRGMRIVGVGKV